MKKTILISTICCVVITTAAFFIYPYLRYPTPENLGGVYIRYSEHEFGKEWDTLMVYNEGLSTGHYQIIRRWKYERTLDGKTQRPDYKKQITKIRAMDNEDSFLEEESGLSYSYNDSRKELAAGTTIYKKIK